MSFNNPKILDIFEKNRKIFESDLDTSLIAGQLWIEVMRYDYNLLSDKENYLSITRFGKLVSD